ncbi:MAG: hypothetical protein WAO35_10295 [Terriglobia bacterium]
MKCLHGAAVPGKGRCRFRPWLMVQVIGAVLSCAPLLSGQYVHESVSYSIGSNGTIYATGVTNAGGMQAHSAWVSTEIYSPSGRVGSGYQSVPSGGYAVANASLELDDDDLGDYTIAAYGGGT